MQNKKISIKRQCELLGLNRSTVYYKATRKKQEDIDGILMAMMDRQYLSCPFYGSRRMTACLRDLGYQVNRKRIVRLMRLMDIQAIYPKKRLSTPAPEHRIFPYLLRGVTASHPDHVWSADITYIPMKQGYLYLVAIMDWYSRYVISWELSLTLDKEFCIQALKRALKTGKPRIFNTDQGSQFTSHSFTKTLLGQKVAVSMDGRGRVFDNIFNERLWRSLKYEEVYLKAYDSVKEARESIAEYFEFYNKGRHHQSLGYRKPYEIYHQVEAIN